MELTFGFLKGAIVHIRSGLTRLSLAFHNHVCNYLGTLLALLVSN